MRILIIEDDSLFSEILQTFLEDNGCSTTVTGTLSDARAVLSATVFDFVLVDNHLPDGDGINFIDTIKSLSTIPTPIMMITGEDNQNVMADVFEKGADDFLVKPISLDLLWHKIQRVRSLYLKESKLADQRNELDRLLGQKNSEDELARYVYEHVIADSVMDKDCVETYIQSSSTFSGDVFVSDTAPNGNRFVILADATGHGLAAAISILPLIATLKAMIRKGLSLAHIVHEANTKLCKELPDDRFVALIGIEINFNSKTLSVFNGGMPEIVALRKDGDIDYFTSNTMALGILDPDDFDTDIVTKEYAPYKNILIISDGLIEQTDLAGEEYGFTRFINVIGTTPEGNSIITAVVDDFSDFNGIREVDDDISICDLQIGLLADKHQCDVKKEDSVKTGKFSASIQMSGGILTASDIVGCLDGVMRTSDVEGDLRQRSFTVFAELISNAFDHGILGLDSQLKNDIEGFADYIATKEERMGKITEDDSLEMHLVYEPTLQQIQFSIKDSGEGYDMDKVAGMKDDALSGRGIPLIDKLCKEVNVTPPGNSTSVTIKREC